MDTLRFADSQTAGSHPLRASDALPPVEIQGNTAKLRWTLPSLPAGTILLPSFASLAEEPYRFRFRLNDLPLLETPSARDDEALLKRSNEEGIEQQLDYFLLREAQSTPTLTLSIEPASVLTSRFLLCLSSRPLTGATPTTTKTAALTQSMRPLSQRLAPPKLAPHICSPTSLAMALGYLGKTVDWLTFVHACRDDASRLFGVWPKNIYQASRAGALGAVEAFSDWSNALTLLAEDLPVVASIRYPEDALPGAPQPASAGHLVTLTGVDAQSALVNDPAGESLDAVVRRYPRTAFAKAWFEHRGAAYYLLR